MTPTASPISRTTHATFVTSPSRALTIARASWTARGSSRVRRPRRAREAAWRSAGVGALGLAGRGLFCLCVRAPHAHVANTNARRLCGLAGAVLGWVWGLVAGRGATPSSAPSRHETLAAERCAHPISNLRRGKFRAIFVILRLESFLASVSALGVSRMARSPAMSAPMPPAPDDADPTAGGGDDTGASDTGADAGDMSDTVLVTIASAPDGGYIVYSGDEPDGDDGESADDDAAVGGAGSGVGGGAPGAGGGAAGGQRVDSIGAALKAALDIMQEAASSAGAPGTADDQFASGFGADQSPTPASAKGGRGMKFPPAAA
jgi:hypothetical protein